MPDWTGGLEKPLRIPRESVGYSDTGSEETSRLGTQNLKSFFYKLIDVIIEKDSVK